MPAGLGASLVPAGTTPQLLIWGGQCFFEQLVPALIEPTARPSASSKPRLREWAYAQAYQNSDQRSAELLTWLHRYIGRH